MDKDGSFIARCLNPLKRDRMIFCHITTHIQDDVGISKIDIMVGHCTTSERLSQSRHRGAVSDACLMLDIDDAE
jgi:hypothetical protein